MVKAKKSSDKSNPENNVGDNVVGTIPHRLWSWLFQRKALPSAEEEDGGEARGPMVSPREYIGKICICSASQASLLTILPISYHHLLFDMHDLDLSRETFANTSRTGAHCKSCSRHTSCTNPQKVQFSHKEKEICVFAIK